MDALTIDDVFRSVILVTLKSSHNSALRTAYDQILDDLDDDKDLTFAHIQTRSVLANLGEPRSDTRIHLTAMTPGELRRAPRPSKPRSTTSTNIKEVTNSPLLCNTLEQHGEQSGKVFRRAGLADAEWNEPASVTTLFMAAQKHFPGSVPSDTDDDDDTVYHAADAYESDD
jgi:hypothetical protein